VNDHEVWLPPRFSQRRLIDGNAARQLLDPPCTARIRQEPVDHWFALAPDGTEHHIRQRGTTAPGESGLELEREHLLALPTPPPEGALHWARTGEPGDPQRVLADLEGCFQLRTENQTKGTPGLRVPQAGAVHAVLAHWSTKATEPATIVLPTGAGKTETMLSLIVSERLDCILILVPSERLRVQIAEVMETYGVLPEVGVLERPKRGLVVGRIDHAFKDARQARIFARGCNVMIATPDALRAASEDAQGALIASCSHLFVDEAHHLGAASWARIRDAFAGKPVLQFTATPFREDGQRLGGRVIYSFPLGLAQRLGYFQPIDYISVVALADADRKVAHAAIEQLRADLAAGRDHLIMARVKRIAKAREEVLPIYEELAPDLAPRVLHSDLGAVERADALRAIRTRDSRIIICVDMLGEGYDFPALKIAALHDPFRSLGPTLQFIGRFARSRADLGSATAVVSRPDPGYDERLRELFAEDPQWDNVIRHLSEEAVEDVQALDDFEQGFAQGADEALSIHVLRPKMSAVVYRTSCDDWRPELIAEHFSPDRVVSPLSVNAAERVAWIVVEDRSAVRWAQLSSLVNTSYHLHLLWWDTANALLYINTSQLESLHEDLAKRVCGPETTRITGDDVYRALAEIQRPTPTNVGVIDIRNRSRRFSMHVGADVYEGFPDVERQSKSNTNIFLVGYLEGERVTLGAAAKGRVWSQQAAESILSWVRWCSRIGPRLVDPSITTESLLRSFVRPKPLSERPDLVPLAIDWSWVSYAEVAESVKLEVGDETGLLLDADLVLTDHTKTGPISYEVRLDDHALDYEAFVHEGDLVHRALGQEAMVLRERSDPEPLSAYLKREGATVWFEDEVLINGPVIYRLERDTLPIDPDKLLVLDWTGVNIRRESQGANRDPGTVQARAAERLIGLDDWDVVIDDDDSGEIADLVAVRDAGDRVVVALVHCKFSSEDKPGARVKDLYEVCGQAHRSAHHRQHVQEMLDNLIRRERKRAGEGRSGLLVGDDDTLLGLQDAVRRHHASFRIAIAQPGLSKQKATQNILRLLAATDVYVSEVAYGTFEVWCSE
jgi:superfamily II DNA or RNA helicase